MGKIIFLIVSLFSSVAGAICGIGGGVIIKPVLDMTQLASVSTISFLSGCTVLAMCSYSVGRAFVSKDASVDLKNGTPLAVGAAIGGVTGQQLFIIVRALFENQDSVGAVQAVMLFIITLGTLIYTLKKQKIHTLGVHNFFVDIVIGLALGVMSSFLGIGGGPINLVVLSYFFSMETKVAASNSLYIIFFGQLFNLITTIVLGNVPDFEVPTLILMIIGGIGGGIIGRSFSRRMQNATVDKLFVGLMIVIMGICLWNACRYSGIV